MAVWLDGVWYLDTDGNGAWEERTTDQAVSVGWKGTTPVTGDWNGDGRTEVGAFISGYWYLDLNGNGVWDREPADRVYHWSGAVNSPVFGRE